ncbi:uncharacterized protein CEXT_102741 [Caerostris extrusa]|uniref:Uncharacterized protein n=1 Tax=Caerostris extrusa TaxID=172846 RepID=A0AAV4M816_CAEEX|nr:uncharacterized protein CEXT_102741 [Caerostris extrusa]
MLYAYAHATFFMLTFANGLITMMFVSLLSYKIYYDLSDIMNEYRRSLLKLIINNYIDELSIQKCLADYRLIVDCIDQVETGFSGLTLFWLDLIAGKNLSRRRCLEKLVVRFSEKAAYNFYVDGKICLPKLHCFGLLAETIRGTTLELSGGNLFVLKYNLILSVIGLMVTYGVLIFNLNNFDVHDYNKTNASHMIPRF